MSKLINTNLVASQKMNKDNENFWSASHNITEAQKNFITQGLFGHNPKISK